MDMIRVLPNRYSRRREKVFGPGRCRPLDRNAKVRITVYARAWSARHRQPGQHRGPLTRAYLEVLHALLWGFHNSRTGRCFPSYETIAKRAECCRDTVYQAIKALEAAGILTWVNRLVRVEFWEKDLFGKRVPRTRLMRTSNAYVFHDRLAGATISNAPVQGQNNTQKPANSADLSSKSENRSETQTQESLYLSTPINDPGIDPAAGVSRALKKLQTAIGTKTPGI